MKRQDYIAYMYWWFVALNGGAHTFSSLDDTHLAGGFGDAIQFCRRYRI
jgi:hypothetical protein